MRGSEVARLAARRTRAPWMGATAGTVAKPPLALLLVAAAAAAAAAASGAYEDEGGGGGGAYRDGVSVSGPFPPWPAVWQLNLSTILMPCNETALTPPAALAGWALQSYDWSNAKTQWAAAKPMNAEELLFAQARSNAGSGVRTWVYRNSIKALPWFSSVREKLADPAFAPWFLPFGPCAKNNSCHVPVCDANYHPPLCSSLYHDGVQTPGFPHGDGDCAAPACDVGAVPVGEYVFNPLAANVSIKGQTLFEWFLDGYLFSPTGAGPGSPISGFFFDDQMGPTGPTEMDGRAFADMGVNASQGAALSAAYYAFMAAVYAALPARGAFSWQQLWTAPGGGFTPAKIGTTCPEPLVARGSCAADLRALCNTSSVAWTRATMSAFSPGRCKTDTANLTSPVEDITAFLLARGPYSVIGHGWAGCGRVFQYPPELNWDVGEPLGVCGESAEEPGVWVREYTGATVRLNCTSWAANVTLRGSKARG